MNGMNIFHWTFIVLLYTKVTGQFDQSWLVVFVPLLLFALYLMWVYAQYQKTVKVLQQQFGGQQQIMNQLAPRRAPSLRVVSEELPGEAKPDDDDDTPKVH